MPTSIVCVDPREDPRWLNLVTRTASSVFHSPSWMRVLADTYGWQPSSYILLDEQGEPRAGIPFCRIVDMVGDRIVSLPFSDYCDPLVSDADSWHRLVGRLLPEHLPIAMRCLHNNLPLADSRFPCIKQAKWHSLDLRPQLDSLWASMHDSTRRAIRKSQREGLTIRFAESEEELRTFFEMHLRVRKYKYGLLAQPYAFFRNIWREFVEARRGFLVLALYEGKIVAGDFFLIWKDTLYYKFNASIPDDLSHRPNDLLIWEAIQDGKKLKLHYLDFGLSDMDQEGLIRYKRKFGTEEKTISFLRHEPNGGPTVAEKEARAFLGRLSHRFTDRLLPDHWTEHAGENLYRFFC
jgi:CelD/BcsL family acetyltransferase involved in cellulose biosynthesis